MDVEVSKTTGPEELSALVSRRFLLLLDKQKFDGGYQMGVRERSPDPLNAGLLVRLQRAMDADVEWERG